MRKLRFEMLESRKMLAIVLPGDYDLSGKVTQADYDLWKESFGQTVHVAGMGADGNLDGVIDAADYTVWRENLGKAASSEPITLADGSFVVRHAFAGAANSLIVAAGETVTLAAESEFDYIEVHGTLRVSRAYDTTLRFVDLIVFEGGTLDMGTADDPVLRKVDFVVKDQPIDLAVDPYQLGNGIINFGTWNGYGQAIDNPWRSAEEMEAGDAFITLDAEPVGWHVGDELLIPDTAQMAGSVRTESTVTITAIDGNTITLDKPLDFDHRAVRDPDGNIRLMPYVANITRNIVIRSENPEGTRGHTIQLRQSQADVRYVSFLGMGRTLAEPLDNTRVVDGQIVPGMNQIARYAWHWHHVHPEHHGELPHDHPHAGHLVGTYFDGSDIGKWGIVIHGTSDMHVADNVTNAFVGAGIVTEDGNEFRNVIEGNFATGSLGNAGNNDSKFAAVKKNPGGEGAGFWFHSIENTIRDNVAVNNNIGFVSLNMVYPANVKPGDAGRVAIEFSGNVALSNLRHGFETWRSELATVYDGLVSANNGDSQFFFGSAERGSGTIRDSLFLAQGGVTWGIKATTYGTGLRMVDTEILGAATGIGTFSDLYEVTNSTFQNRVNFDWTPRVRQEIPMTTLDGVSSLALPGQEVTHFLLGEYVAKLANFHFNDNVGYKILLRNWQQSGQSYILYRPHSAPDVVIEVEGTQGYLVSGGPMTNADAWARYGIALDGGVIPDNALPLENSEGYVVEFTGDKPTIDLGISRLVQVTPSNYTPSNGRLRLFFRYTGNPADLSTIFAIDGITISGRPVQVDEATGTMFTELIARPNLDNGWSEPGEHTLSTWRTLDGEMIEGSQLEFEYTLA